MRRLNAAFSVFVVSAALLAGVSLPAHPGAAQAVAGQNVNMVSGTKWPGGDPFLQRQNEPSLAVSSRNVLHLVAGANDYRTVDLPIEAGSVPGTLRRRLARRLQVVRRRPELAEHAPAGLSRRTSPRPEWPLP